jgi:alpha-N-arabinofuranosidase
VSADRKFLSLAVVNATESTQQITLNVTGTRLSRESTLWQMTSKDLDAANRVGEKPQVEVKEVPIGGAATTLPVAAISINIYRFPVVQTPQ